MRIDLWSDVVCPWCYVGKRRLEAALADFEHADEVEVVWHTFLLDPEASADATETLAAHLGRKYGGGEAAGRQMIERTEAVAAEEGLVFRLHQAQRANTVDAHRLLHLARAEGRQGTLEEALFAAYFTEGRNVADHDTLREIAVRAGLDPARVDDVLASDGFAEEVRADLAQAQRYGITGVPFFVVDERYGVAGAQPAEVLREVLERAWSEREPVLELVPGPDMCGPEGCSD